MNWTKINHWTELPQEECGSPFLAIYDKEIHLASYDGDSNYYLTSDPREEFVFAMSPLHIYFECYKGCTNDCNEENEHAFSAYKLTHWMPLPALPSDVNIDLSKEYIKKLSENNNIFAKHN